MAKGALSLQEINRQVELVRSVKDDPEAAHSAEDELHHRVMLDIAHGRHPDMISAQHAAKAALRTKRIKFARWAA